MGFIRDKDVIAVTVMIDVEGESLRMDGMQF